MAGRGQPLDIGQRWSLGERYLSGLLAVDAHMEQTATSYYPAVPAPWPKELTRQWYHYNGGIDGFYWPVSDPADKLYAKLKSIPVGADISKYPTLFTGKMRMVVQKLQGAGKAIPFDHTVTRSDGLFTPPGDGLDREKPRWVISIRRDGIFAAPIAFYREKMPADTPQDHWHLDRYDFQVRGTWAEKTTVVTADKLTYDNKSPTCLQLAARSSMDGIFIDANNPQHPDKTPLVPHLGWAFSYQGAEAQLILLGQKTYGDSQFVYSTRYKLQFGWDGALPTYGGWTQVDADYLYTGVTQPFYVSSLGGVALAGGYGRISGGTAVPASTSAPVFIFYDREGGERLLHYTTTATATLDNQTLDTRGNYYGVIQPVCACHAEVDGNTDGAHRGTVTVYIDRSTATAGFSCALTTSPTANRVETQTETDYRIGDYVNDDGGVPGNEWRTYCSESAYVVWSILQQRAPVYTDEHASAQHTIAYYDILGIPPYEAEGFFHFTHCRERVTAHTVTYTDAGFGAYAIRYTALRRVDLSVSPAQVEEFSCTASSATSGRRVLSTDTLPLAETVTQQYWYVDNRQVTPLADPGRDISSDLFHVYAAITGAFSGNQIVFPWPRALWVTDAVNYPVSELWVFQEGDLIYPNLLFLGDEA